MSKGRVQLIDGDMPGGMQNDAVNVAARAVKLYWDSYNIAKYIVEEFNRMYETPWVCFVSKVECPGGYSYYNLGHRIRFKIDDCWIELFRTRDLH